MANSIIVVKGVARILFGKKVYKFSRFSVHGCDKLIAPRYFPVLKTWSEFGGV